LAYYAHKNDNIDLIANHDLKIISVKEKIFFSDNDLNDN
jgi:hypothetical protein